ncbi:hypothetical protein KCTC52924_01123 [Arenibacter antarcticus]|uniref:AAA family ATPase n=1 Tax=Arenibacter antarcticus TaxID=2040469 RepID=A0ABW5VDR9_9FLAO|nr:AAA family ATPase [Arenibacter sp. H213]MCM4168051.1 hypothetical protein [Arenibacter sp. H213]
MEILAIYIEDHFLYKEPIYLNFGGRFIFKFNKEKDYLKITKENNINFIEEFYSKGISNISAIVGNNGVGKTSLMRVLNQEPKSNALAIYGEGNKIFVQNATKNKIEWDFDFESINHEESPFPLYYSNVLDYNLIDFNSPISESNKINDSLSEYFYDTILRQIFFIYKKGESLKNKYPELPLYDDVSISINNVSKSQLLDNDFYRNATIGQSIKEQLNMLWDSYGQLNEEMIHKNEEFLTNFEVFILTLLVTDDIFAQTNNNGFKIGFDEILDQDDFDKKLELFLKKRLDNIDGPLFDSLEEKSGIKFNNIDDIIYNIRADKISQIGGGFDFVKIKDKAIRVILQYHRIFLLYDFLKLNNQIFQNHTNKSELKLKVSDETTLSILKELFRLYEDVHETLENLNFKYRVFNVNPTRKMSTGELSILNLYSSIYQFVTTSNSSKNTRESYLLLLDEPEHAYHAVWKKKFIWTLNETIQELFADWEQDTLIQIIFSTHDALTLSDLPNDKISYLKRLNDQTIKAFDEDDKDRPLKSFGANITEILADSFFVEDGLIGDFAKEKINNTIDWLRNKEDIQNYEYHKKLIQIIDEPIVQQKLSEMYSEKMNVDFSKEILTHQIENLKQKFKIQTGDDYDSL